MLSADTRKRLDYALARQSAGAELESLLAVLSFGTSYFVDGTSGNNGRVGTSAEEAVATITKALTLASDGDVIFVAPGAYDETVTVNKNKLTIIGVGGRGSVFIEPTTAGAEGMRVTAADVTLINIGVSADDTGDYALNVHGNTDVNTDGVRRFRAYGCKFEKPTGGSGADCAVLFDGDDNDQAADCLLFDCEVAWCKNGILFDASGYGVPTQIFIRRTHFHNFTTVAIGEVDNDAYVDGLEVTDCTFDVRETGTDPTDFIVVDHANSVGIFSGNRFAYESNATALLTIGAKIMWVANATEGGWSTGRPA